MTPPLKYQLQEKLIEEIRKAERERLRMEIERLTNHYLLFNSHQCIISTSTENSCTICHELNKYYKEVLALLSAPTTTIATTNTATNAPQNSSLLKGMNSDGEPRKGEDKK